MQRRSLRVRSERRWITIVAFILVAGTTLYARGQDDGASPARPVIDVSQFSPDE